MLVGGIVVGDGVDQLSRGHGALDRVEEADELLVPVLRHAAAQYGAVPDIERGEQGGDVVALVIMGHGAAFAGFEWEPGLGAIERLDLRLLVDGQHHGVHRRIHVEADDVRVCRKVCVWGGTMLLKEPSHAATQTACHPG